MVENEPNQMLQPPIPPQLSIRQWNPYAIDAPLPSSYANQNAEFVDKIVRAEISENLLKSLPPWLYSSFINKIAALAYLNDSDERFIEWQLDDLYIVALNRVPLTQQSTAFLVALKSLYQFSKMSITRSRGGRERDLFITNFSSATIEHRGAPSGDMPIQVQGNPRPSGMDKLKKWIGGK